ncbi:AzlD domain-containing protein [Paenibacillus doosanensis]|uniref:Branched-chain amino acid transport protein (AzlD) n=1 Tax=Paenibacillus konkukensis TaxID=2020716 RepID=A0ABY4RDP5_9BACL|nr:MULTISPECIES: AzlD domain-containing protein [Paenibacillus]MCS7462275.1 AzlD domain-containing protein [Paenibacillus doosanensis]UQZ80919.1 Branched-chain amino acid transport protein (AzlD) [Paenibacillus konkukensis]
MEIKWYILIVIIGSAVVTFLPRVIPLMVLSRLQLPEWGMRWLKYVPISVMAALVGQELLMKEGDLIPWTRNIELLAALPTFLVAVFTRSLLGTVVTGIAAMFVLRWLF